jgi:hypothetical protein
VSNFRYYAGFFVKYESVGINGRLLLLCNLYTVQEIRAYFYKKLRILLIFQEKVYQIRAPNQVQQLFCYSRKTSFDIIIETSDRIMLCIYLKKLTSIPLPDSLTVLRRKIIAEHSNIRHEINDSFKKRYNAKVYKIQSFSVVPTFYWIVAKITLL